VPLLARGSQSGDGGFPLGVASLLQGVGFSLVAALGLSTVVGLAVAWTPAWDASDGLLKALNLLAVAAGGLLAGRRAPRLGWLHGGLVGLVYVLLVTGMLVPDGGLGRLISSAGLAPAVYAFLAGTLGGMLGVLSR